MVIYYLNIEFTDNHLRGSMALIQVDVCPASCGSLGGEVWHEPAAELFVLQASPVYSTVSYNTPLFKMFCQRRHVTLRLSVGVVVGRLEVDGLHIGARVVASGVSELTVGVLAVDVAADEVGDTEEVGQVLRVGDVGVEVVLEVLEHVHVLLDEGVAADAGEGEGLVVELPGLDVPLGSAAGGGDGSGDVLGVRPVAGVEGAREHLELVVEFLLGLIEVDARG